MGTVISNLKARFGVDTTDFKKGLKDGEKAMTGFKDAGSDAIDKFAGLFGVNMQAVKDSMGTVSKSLNFLGQSFKGAAAGGDFLAISLKVLKSAIIATGIGALVIALGSLYTYFTQTERGAKQLASGIAQMKAETTVAKQRFADFGDALMMMFKVDFKTGWDMMKLSFRGMHEEMKGAGETAKNMAQNIYDLTYEEMNYNRVKSEQEIIMAGWKLKSRDLELSAQERLSALIKYSSVENGIDEKEKALLASKIIIAQQDLALDTQSIEKKKALNDATIAYNNAITENIMNDYALQREKNRLIKEIQAQLDAQKKLNAVTKISDSGASFGKASSIDTSKLVNMPNYKKGTSDVKEFSQANVDMAATVNDALASMASGFGEWVGAYASGMAGVKELRQMVGNTFGDMLIMLGQTAIKTGIGIKSIRVAFQSLQGVGAIAAGVALVAFGAYIKGSIAHAGASMGSSSSGGGYDSGSFTYDSRVPMRNIGAPLQVNVTGRLTGQGKDLVAIIEQEGLRRNSTT